MFADGILQKQQYVHGWKHDITLVPYSLIKSSKGHQGTIHIFEEIRRYYWWPKLWQKIVKYIGKYGICAKHFPNITKYPQQHLLVSQIPMAMLAIDTIGH